MFVPLFIKDARLVEVVDANLSGSVDDALVVEHHAHMDNLSVFVAEKGQVSRLDLWQEINQLAFFDLFGGITGKELAGSAGAKLDKPAAVDAENTPSTP